MAEWEEVEEYQTFGYIDDRYLSADSASRRPLSTRRPLSRGPHERRPSLHRRYHSDNEAISDRGSDFPDFHDPESLPMRAHPISVPRVPSPPIPNWPRLHGEVSRTKQIPSPPPLHRGSRKRVPSLPPRNRRASSPPSKFKQASSPPLFSHRRSSIKVLRPARSRTPRPSSPADDDAYYYSEKRSQSPGMKSRRHERNSYPVPGGFPSAPGVILPEDSRSDVSTSRFGWRPWSTKTPSAATSGSTSRPSASRTSSSGVIGDKIYQYNELRELEFRLIRILPARMSTIKCEILHASLETPPHYIAISYAWGDASDTRRVILESVSIPVAASLHGALEALREKRETVLVWVDALCIDQQNRDERTQQVQMMTRIYSKADSVAIWLGPEADDSNLAAALLEEVASRADSVKDVKSLISAGVGKPDFAAVVSLFERDYWRRLWVVQEVFNAKDIVVYCGSTKLPWDVFRLASHVFWRHKDDLGYYFPGGNNQKVSQNQSTYSQVLVYQGPGSFPDLNSLIGFGEESLLEVMRACRRKLSSDPRDKVFGILGVLPQEIRSEFAVDYTLSVKDVYINVVDYILSTTDSLDIICESIHFPLHTSSASLPTWVPDWSYMPETTALSRICDFSAASTTKTECRFADERRNKIEISAIYVDTIILHGIAVGTLCTLADYLMAFLHWRALLLDSGDNEEEHYNLLVQDTFCRTLCLDQVPSQWDNSTDWLTVCYFVFASLIRDRLPRLSLDRELRRYASAKVNIDSGARRQFLQEHFGSRMMGRCFCITEEGRMGIGSGFMAVGDVVVVPLGCSTPVILRPEGNRGEYRFVGDIYINGYMHGKAVEKWRSGEKELQKYVLH
ncbi:uncharacterized protein BDR25DRAFT_304884 [Lindgomyces ingoldianus]|uniref:Uncharacterized protein n=1 Tax=Lindgomyces ingoldianus TaxID=673940 RepID=A0ACB6QNE4_9PLEO|nr:uncharacterized protein BDR25DRAFT_304884 [Lindgomyces ingoldianus]KAF2468420.1 hypothetical protein BDR25DRAFT_304884 [Lindgomyces ingoldianus]